MRLSVIIPAHNEAKRIGPTLEAVGTWLAAQPYDSEIIVVDSWSSDTTADVVRGFMSRFRSIRLIDDQRHGKGYAVTTGMLFATGQVRLFMDADNSTTIEEFEKMEPYLNQGYDVVIASIAAKGARIVAGGEEPVWRVVMGKLANIWIQFWAVPGIWDTQRGFKVFTAKAANDIFRRMTTFGWLFDVEVLAIARAHHYRIREVPITWNNDPNSTVKPSAYLTSLLECTKIAWNRFRGVYKK